MSSVFLGVVSNVFFCLKKREKALGYIRYIKRFFVAITLFFPLWSGAKPVVLLELDWSSQQVLTHVLDTLLKSRGVDSKIVAVPAKGQWFYLSSGRADIQVEVWEGTMSTSLEELIALHRVKVGAVHQILSREGWWYPQFAEEKCPLLPSWRALIECKAVFSDEKGIARYYSGPWEKPENARIRALNLPIEIVQLKGGDAINMRIIQAMKLKQPILIFNWSPNWVEHAYKGRFIEFPAYEPECETNSEWGVNPTLPWDCGNPKQGWLKTVTSTFLEEKSPCALAITQSFVLQSEDLSYASYLVDAKGQSIEQAANTWLAHNQSRVAGWTQHPQCQASK